MVACAVLPGCLGTGENAGTGTSTETPEPGWYDVCEFAPSLAAGDLPPDEHAVVVHVRSAAAADEVFATDSLTDEARTTVEAFVEETSFEAATLFYVETRAPNACYGARIESLDLEDDLVTGEVVAKDVSGQEEACAQVETTPAVLFRVRGDSGPPTAAELAVTNGWGDTRTLQSIPPDEYDPGTGK